MQEHDPLPPPGDAFLSSADRPIGMGLADESFKSSPPPAAAPRKALPRRPSTALPRLLWLLVAMVILLVIRYTLPYFVEEIQYAATRGRQRAELEAADEGLKNSGLGGLSAAYQLVAKKMAPSVVHINTRRVAGPRPRDEVSHLFGRPEQQFHSHGQGSGVIVDEEGYIVTNAHVIRGASEIDVMLSEGRTVKGRLIGIDLLTDLAVLKIESSGLLAADWGDSDQLSAGALVWAMGSPFGLDHSITSGILSAKNRQGFTGPHQSFLQTDAAVNPGNSGGPLVDSLGRVVGINTAILGQSYQGISFAIPSNIARDVFERIKKDGRVARGWLGVALDEVTEQRAKQLGLSKATGALVMAVVGDQETLSPAMRAGLQPGDVIVLWGGREVDGPTSLSRMVAQTKIGKKTPIVIVRKGEKITLEVTVGERPMRLN